MEGIFWIAAYPRSGDTWLRVLLANWLSGKDEPVRLGELHRYGMAYQDNLPALWEHVTGKALPSEQEQFERAAEVQRALPRFAQEKLGAPQPVLFCKTHAARGRVKGHDTIARDITLGAIHIVRDPRTVAPSVARFNDISLEEATRLMGDQRSTLGKNKASQYVSSWSVHTVSWIRAGFSLRYEDLPGAFEAVLEYLHFPKDERLTRAIAFSSFKDLARQEAEDRSVAQGRGEFVDAASELPLPDELRTRIEQDHGPVMKTFGYL